MEQRHILPDRASGSYLTPEFVAARLREDSQAPEFLGDHDLNPGVLADPPLRQAAVLVPLVLRPEEMTVLLTRRTSDLPHHAGQVSFPGGGIDPEDRDAEAAALREAWEEIGLDPAKVKVIGRLRPYLTRTGFHITPVVGVIVPPFELTLAPREVAEAFEVRCSVVADPANHHPHEIVLEEKNYVTYNIPFDGQNIWGATAAMLVSLGRILAPPEPAG